MLCVLVHLLFFNLQVRIYNEGLQDDELTAHISLPSLERPILKSYATLHFRMEDSASSLYLLNSGLLSNATSTMNGGEFVTVCIYFSLKGPGTKELQRYEPRKSPFM